MARRPVNPLFGWQSRQLYGVPVTAAGLAPLHNLAVEHARASTLSVRNVPGKFPNGKKPETLRFGKKPK